jgi:hypothetical protein
MQNQLCSLIIKYRTRALSHLHHSLRGELERLSTYQKQRLTYDWYRFVSQNDRNHPLLFYFLKQQPDQRQRLSTHVKFCLLLVLYGIQYLNNKYSSIHWDETAKTLVTTINNQQQSKRSSAKDYLDNDVSLSDTYHGIQHAHQFLNKLNIDTTISCAPLLPEIKLTYPINHEYQLFNSSDAIKIMKPEIVVDDLIQLEEQIKQLFIEWFSKCRMCLVENMNSDEVLHNMNLETDNQSLSMVALSLIPSELYVLSFILDREHNQTSDIHTWSKLSDKQKDEVLIEIKCDKRKDNILNVVTTFIVESRDVESTRSLQDIESDLKQLLVTHPLYSSIYCLLYNHDIEIETTEVPRIYSTQQKTSICNTIFTKLNSILHESQQINASKYCDNFEEEQPSTSKSATIELDALDYESESQIQEAMKDSLTQQQIQNEKQTLGQLIQRSIANIQAQQATTSSNKNQIFREEWNNFQTSLQRSQERNRRVKLLYDVLRQQKVLYPPTVSPTKYHCIPLELIYQELLELT